MRAHFHKFKILVTACLLYDAVRGFILMQLNEISVQSYLVQLETNLSTEFCEKTTSHFYGRIVLDWCIKRFHIVSLCANEVSGIPQLTCISLLMGRYFMFFIILYIEHARALCSLTAQPKNCKRKPT